VVGSFRPYKYSNSGSDQAVMAWLHAHGVPKNVPESMKDVVSKYLQLRESCYPDLSPYLPQDDPVGIPGATVDVTRLASLLGLLVEGEGFVTHSQLAEDCAYELLGLVPQSRLGYTPAGSESDYIRFGDLEEREALTSAQPLTEEPSLDDVLDDLFKGQDDSKPGKEPSSGRIKDLNKF